MINTIILPYSILFLGVIVFGKYTGPVDSIVDILVYISWGFGFSMLDRSTK
jgi:hypothetical protein